MYIVFDLISEYNHHSSVFQLGQTQINWFSNKLWNGTKSRLRNRNRGNECDLPNLDAATQFRTDAKRSVTSKRDSRFSLFVVIFFFFVVFPELSLLRYRSWNTVISNCVIIIFLEESYNCLYTFVGCLVNWNLSFGIFM